MSRKINLHFDDEVEITGKFKKTKHARNEKGKGMKVINSYVEEHYDEIEHDMNTRNSASKRKEMMLQAINNENTIANSSTNANSSVEILSTGAKNKTRKKREELSSSATKSIKKEFVDIVITFN